MNKLTPDWLAWEETQVLVAAFQKHGVPLRFVGGCVRDALLKRHVKDVDAATPLPPEETMELLKKSGIHAIPTGIEHGTVTAIIARHHFEITTLRRDVTTDGRHAEVAFTDDWKEDAARRDFTMNALYLSPAGELFDYFGGVADATAGHVRFIGNAATRIAEDYLRILRFFRFFAHYGKGAMDKLALHDCAAAAPHLTSLSGERVQQELLKLLGAPHAYPVLETMQQKHILEPALGFAVHEAGIFARLESVEQLRHLTLSPAVKLMGFILAAGMEPSQVLALLGERLKLPGATVKMLRTLITHQRDVSPHLMPDAQKYWLRRLGTEDFEALVSVNWSAQEKEISEDHPYNAMLYLADEWVIPDFPVAGKDLIALGMKEGKEMGELLKMLEQRWEESDYTMTKGEMLKTLTL